MKHTHELERGELKELVDPVGSRFTSTIATAGTTLILGFVVSTKTLFLGSQLLLCILFAINSLSFSGMGWDGVEGYGMQTGSSKENK